MRGRTNKVLFSYLQINLALDAPRLRRTEEVLVNDDAFGSGK